MFYWHEENMHITKFYLLAGKYRDNLYIEILRFNKL